MKLLKAGPSIEHPVDPNTCGHRIVGQYLQVQHWGLLILGWLLYWGVIILGFLLYWGCRQAQPHCALSFILNCRDQLESASYLRSELVLHSQAQRLCSSSNFVVSRSHTMVLANDTAGQINGDFVHDTTGSSVIGVDFKLYTSVQVVR